MSPASTSRASPAIDALPSRATVPDGREGSPAARMWRFTGPCLLLACGEGAAPGESSAPDPTDTGIGVSAELSENPDNPFSVVVTVSTDADADVYLRHGEVALDQQTPTQAVVAGAPAEILVLGLAADREHQLEVVATAPGRSGRASLTWTTAPLPEGFPVCTPSFTAPEEDFDPDELFCTNSLIGGSEHVYWCADHWGEPRAWIRTADDDSLMSAAPMPGGGFVATSNNTSKLLFFDEGSATTAQYLPSWFADQTRFSHDWIDSHEAYVLPGGAWAGHVAVVTSAWEWFDEGVYRIGNGLLVVDPATGLAEYDFSFHGLLGDGVPADPLLPYEREGWGDFAEDWTHLNRVAWGEDPDGREFFLLSLKAQDWIVKLYPDDDSLAWALGWGGSFTLVDSLDAAEPVVQPGEAWFFHQHDVELLGVEGERLRLRLYDNGEARRDDAGVEIGADYSRVLELELDQATMRAATTWRYGSSDTASDEHFYSSICGGASLLADGERLLTQAAEQGLRLELSYPEGEERWRMQCDQLDICEYRLRAWPSVYDPLGP